MFVYKAGVAGAGVIGAQVAALSAAAGIPVALCDTDAAALERALEWIRESTAATLEALVARGGLGREEAAAQLEHTLGLISASTGYEGFGDADIAIEAVGDHFELKQDVLAVLDAATPGHAVLASATSAFSITDLAAATVKPARVVGLHFLHPLAQARAVEVVEALETDSATIATAQQFVAALRRSAARSQDTPGFIVNRVALAAATHLWRAAAEEGIDPRALDAAVVDAGAARSGPLALVEQLGRDTTLALAARLQEAYGERFAIPSLEVAAPAAEGPDTEELVERYELRAFAEACEIVQEGVAGVRDVDLAVSAGAGMRPPFATADARGLVETAARLEHAAAQWGEDYEPPLLLARMIAQGRGGRADGQGFFPFARPDDGAQEGPVKLETRGEVAIAWLDNPPANAITIDLVAALERAWETISAGGQVGALVLASANPALFCAGADIKAFATMDAATQARFVERVHALVLAMARSRIVTIAAVNGLALGGGCELAMAADIRIAARSASFGQPEIKLGIIPGFGGTQRLPRLIGAGRALELNLTGEPIDALEAWELGLVNRLAEDHELIDVALSWARRLAAQAPIALAEIKRLSSRDDLDAGLAAEQEAFARVFESADAREGIAAFVQKRPPRFRGA